MSRHSFTAFILSLALFSSPILAEESLDCFSGKHKSQTTNFIAPVFDFTYAAQLTDNSAFSLLGEAGPKSYRFGGTIGFAGGKHRFKFTGEQLGQDLQYQFSSSGKIRRWVHQYAVGGAYQLLVCNKYIKSFDFFTSYSRAMNRDLRGLPCESLDHQTFGVIFRQICGARNAHIAIGATLTPWECAELSFTGDWDCTRYVRQFRCDDKASGLGATIRLYQRLANNLNFDIIGEFRRPFNVYGASFGWGTTFNCYTVDAKIYGSYTQSRDNVPNVGTIGLAVDVAFGGGPIFKESFFPRCKSNCNQNPCCFPCFDPWACACLPRICDEELLAWVTMPAVYMPVVLAKTSESVITTQTPCQGIAAQPFPSPVTFTTPGQTFATSSYFRGTPPITFSIQPNTTLLIDPTTGIVTFTGIVPQNPVTINITASNGCSHVTQPIQILVTTF